MSTPDPVAIALARQMPWTVAEPESIWLASGHINPKSSFVDCLLYLDGLFWDKRQGFTYGPGFKAYASDFPPGTKLIVTARIELPAEESL